jgi:hypothetical protein
LLLPVAGLLMALWLFAAPTLRGVIPQAEIPVP